MAKTVAVVLDHSPGNSHRTSEGLRMSVGLVLGKHDVHVMLFDDAALAALSDAGDLKQAGGHELKKHIAALIMLKRKVYAEREALAQLGLDPLPLLKGVELLDRAEMLNMTIQADAVIRY